MPTALTTFQVAALFTSVVLLLLSLRAHRRSRRLMNERVDMQKKYRGDL